MPLISAEEPLPPRGDMHEYFAPASRLTKIRQQTNHCVINSFSDVVCVARL
jgi:hypothetical protein